MDAVLCFRITVLLLLFCASAFSRARTSGYCEQGGQVVVTSAVQSVTKVMQSYPQCIVAVFYTGGANGYVSTNGTAVTWMAGTPFNANSGWAGLPITINGVPYAISTVNSTTSITLSSSAGAQSGVTYSMPPTAPAAIFSDNSGTVQGNPFTSSTTGYWSYFSDNGQYDVRISGGGIPLPITWGSIGVIDPLATTTGLVTFNGSIGTPTQQCSAAHSANQTLIIGQAMIGLTTQNMLCSMLFLEGGLIQPASGQTVTIFGIISASPFKIFDYSAGGIVAFATKPSTAYGEWWGALNDGSTDNCNSLNAAVASLYGGIFGDNGGPAGSLVLQAGAGYNTSCTIKSASVMGNQEGPFSIGGTVQNSAILRYTGSSGANLLETGSYWAVHDLVLDNTGTGARGIYVKEPHAVFDNITSRPLVGFSVADIQTRTDVQIYDVTFRVLYLSCQGSIASSCGTNGGPIGLSVCGGVNMSGYDIFVEDKKIAQIETGDASCTGGTNFALFNSTAQAFEGHTGSDASIGYWASVNTVKWTNIHPTTQMCASGTGTACHHRSFKIDAMVSGVIKDGQFEGFAGGGGSGLITGGTGIDVQNCYFVSVNNPDGDYAISITGGTQLGPFSNNNWQQSVTHLIGGSAALPTWTSNPALPAGSSGSIGAFSTQRKVLVNVIVGAGGYFPAAAGFLGYITWPAGWWSSVVGAAPLCTITPANEATQFQLNSLSPPSSVFYDVADSTTSRAYIGTQRQGISALNNYSWVVDCGHETN